MKHPILSREIFYEVLRDGTMRDLHWALVNTPIGGMLEPRTPFVVDRNRVANLDVYDSSYSRRSEMDEDQMARLFNTAGSLIPSNFNV